MEEEDNFIQGIEGFKKQLDEGTLFPKEKMENYDEQLQKGLKEWEEQEIAFGRDMLALTVKGGGTIKKTPTAVRIMSVWKDNNGKACEIFKCETEPFVTGVLYGFATSKGEYRLVEIKTGDNTDNWIRENTMILIKLYEGSGYRLCWYGERGSKGEGEVL